MFHNATLLTVLLALALPVSAAEHRTSPGEVWKVPRAQRLSGVESLDALVIPEKIRHGIPIIPVGLRNLEARERTFDVRFRFERAPNVTQRLTVAPMGSVRVNIPAPLISENGYTYGSFELTCVESGVPGPYTVLPCAGYFSVADSYHADGVQLLISRSLSGEKLVKTLSSKTFRVGSGKGKSSSSFEADTLRLDCAGELWPRDWRIYSCFDAVLIAPKDRAALPAEVVEALDAYASVGGAVIVTETDGEEGFASGGRAGDALAAISGAAERLARDISFTQRYYARSRNDTAADIAAVPLSATRSLPVGAITLILAVFAAVFIPLAVWQCHRRNRRMLMLAALPLSAFAASLLVAALALLTFGVTPTVRLQGVTFLDQGRKSATTRAQAGIFAPGNVTEDLRFPADASVMMRHAELGGGEEGMTFDDALRPHGTWIKPLTAAFFDIDRVRRASERLVAKPEPDGSLTVANLLGARIAGGTIRRGAFLYRLGPLAPGETATVAATPDRFDDVDSDRTRRLLFDTTTSFGRSWPAVVKLLEGKNGRAALPTDGYVVRLEGSPFVPSPLPDRETELSAESFVIGTFGEEAK